MATVGFASPPVRLLSSRPSPSQSHLPAKHLTFRVRCSAEAAQETAPAEEETVVETPKRSSSSLISVENVQKALRGVGNYSQTLCTYP